MQDLYKQVRHNRLLAYFFIFLLTISIASARQLTIDYNNALTRSIADQMYCKQNGNCIFDTLTINNLTLINGSINIINATIVNLNYTGIINIDGDLIINGTPIGDLYLNSNGDTGIGDYEIQGGLNVTTNITASYFFGDGSQLTGIPAQNPFDQVLNTTSNVQFNNLTTTGTYTGGVGTIPALIAKGFGTGAPPARRGGSVQWMEDGSAIAGYTFANLNGQFVWKSTAQSSFSDTGVAWVDFDDGSANFSSITGVSSITLSSYLDTPKWRNTINYGIAMDITQGFETLQTDSTILATDTFFGITPTTDGHTYLFFGANAGVTSYYYFDFNAASTANDLYLRRSGVTGDFNIDLPVNLNDNNLTTTGTGNKMGGLNVTGDINADNVYANNLAYDNGTYSNNASITTFITERDLAANTSMKDYVDSQKFTINNTDINVTSIIIGEGATGTPKIYGYVNSSHIYMRIDSVVDGSTYGLLYYNDTTGLRMIQGDISEYT